MLQYVAMTLPSSCLGKHEKILAKAKRRLLAAMRSAWLSTFPKLRRRMFLGGSDLEVPVEGVGDDLEYIDLGGEG